MRFSVLFRGYKHKIVEKRDDVAQKKQPKIGKIRKKLKNFLIDT